MKRILLFSTAALVVLVAASAGMQHAHFDAIRQDRVQDKQPVFYNGESFHVLTFVRLHEGDYLVPQLKNFRSITEEGMWIYAGKVIFSRSSQQVGEKEWSGVVLMQYPSREAFENERASRPYTEALSGFAEHYEMGMRRPVLQNLLMPQLLLVNKTWRKVQFEPSPYPFTPAFQNQGALDSLAAQAMLEASSQGRKTLVRLREESDRLGKEAMVVVNINKMGTPEQRERDAAYSGAMLGLMAERNYGPIHAGDAVPFTRDHDFDNVVLVYYPGTGYFADMITSTFFQSIYSDKQLGDYQSTITVPVTDLVGD